MAIIILLAIVGFLLPLPLIGYRQLHRIKPILQTLSRTNEYISFREIRAEFRRTRSAKELMRDCIAFGGFFAILLFNAGLFLYLAITRGTYAGFFFWSAVAILWGFVLVRQVLITMAKARKV
jgi:hypothetical protein